MDIWLEEEVEFIYNIEALYIYIYIYIYIQILKIMEIVFLFVMI